MHTYLDVHKSIYLCFTKNGYFIEFIERLFIKIQIWLRRLNCHTTTIILKKIISAKGISSNWLILFCLYSLAVSANVHAISSSSTCNSSVQMCANRYVDQSTLFHSVNYFKIYWINYPYTHNQVITRWIKSARPHHSLTTPDVHSTQLCSSEANLPCATPDIW